MSKDTVQGPRHLGEIQRGDEQGRGSDLPAAVSAEEAPELLLTGPSSPRWLLLEGAERSDLTLNVDDLLHGGGTEGADQLVLEIRDAHVETDSFHVGASEVGAQAGPVESAPEVALLCGVAEPRKPDVDPRGAEEIQEGPDVLRTSHRHDGDALSIEIPTTALSQRFERKLVADAFNEHDRSCGEGPGGSPWPSEVGVASHPHAQQRIESIGSAGGSTATRSLRSLHTCDSSKQDRRSLPWTTPFRAIENARERMSAPRNHSAGPTGRKVEEELRRMTKRFEQVLEISPTAIVITDLGNRVASWNPAAERLFGYPSEEVAGRNLDDLVAKTDSMHAEADEFRQRVAASEHVQSLTRRTRKDGSIVDVELLAAPLVANGKPVGTFAIYHDITELNRQRRFFEALLEVSPEAIVTTTADDTVASWNPAAERLFGYTAEEALGRDIDELVARRADLQEEGKELDREASEGRMVRAVTQRTRKDGSLVDVDIVGGPVTVGGELVAKHVFYHDISELQQQKRYYESLLEMSPAAIMTVDLDAIVTSWNPAAERLLGYTREEAIGRSIDDLVANNDEVRDQAKDVSHQAALGRQVHLVTRRTRKDGSLVDVDVVAAPIVVGGEQVAYYAMYSDISELQEQKRYFESLLEISPAAIVVTNLESKVVSWNPGAEKVFGYPAGEAIGSLLDDLVASRPEIHEEAVGYSQAAERGERIQAMARRTRKDGSLVDVQMFSEPVVVNEDRVGYVVIYHDVTDIQRQKRYYEALVEVSPVAIALMAREGTINSWNPAAERLFGYTADEAIGRNIDDLVSTTDEIRAEAEAYTARGMSGDIVHAITRRTHRDGTLVDVEMFGAPVIVAGEAVGLYGLYHDIRDLQQARRDAEAATEAKSAFLATMSHEIRTPLNAVIGMTGLLLDTDLSAEQRDYAEVTRSSGDALLGVINDILDFSKIEAGRLDLEEAPFDLRECVESALELAAASALKKGLDIAYDLDAGAPGALVGDVTRLRQVLINLLNNAVKFTERGEVVVTVGAERIAGDRHRVHFAVRDTGIGIPEDRMGRLFESFSQVDPSTTRRHGGTGLGLAISRRLAELMGGTMWVESTVAVGSTFHFTIEAESAPALVRPYEREEPSRLAGRRVLIVDDNDANRHILVKQTRSWGMLAWDSGVPAEAVEWVRRGDPFDVAILDMQMPDMDGLTLAGEIRRYRDAASLPLVMLTSLGRDRSPEGFAAYLTKPIKPSQLYDALMDVFGGKIEAVERSVVAALDDRLAEYVPLRILVVEDNAVNQHLALLMLEKMGYRADVAANGVEALEALERQSYDTVLMDVEMPEMDGLEATRRIHQRWPRDQRPHIVAVTANAMQGERDLCIQAGVDDYITKPIHIEDLVAALRAAARRPGARQPGPAIDPDAIRRLAASFGEGGNGSIVVLIDTFLGHIPGQQEALATALERGEVDEVRRGAHTLKTNAATFGATGLADLCRELEAAGKAGTLEGASRLLSRIEVELERVTGELASIRAELRR
jgi:PAS domain S-box-containing protein